MFARPGAVKDRGRWTDTVVGYVILSERCHVDLRGV